MEIIPFNNQLIPYSQGIREVKSFRRAESQPLLAYRTPIGVRNTGTHIQVAFKDNVRPQAHGPIYNFNRRVTHSRLKQTGLWIDVYA